MAPYMQCILLALCGVSFAASANSTRQWCSGAATVGSKCYSSLSAAVSAAPSDGEVELVKSVAVTAQITLDKTLTIRGNGYRITARLSDGNAGTIFRATKSDITVTFSDIEFVNGGDTASVLRTPELGTNPTPANPKVGPVNLVMDNCVVSGFKTKSRGGSAIALGWTNKVKLSYCTFEDNVVDTAGSGEQWDGCGAVWVMNAYGPISIVGCVFTNNKQLYGHGLGGAVGVIYMEGDLRISGGRFVGNTANGGGALYVANLPSGSTVDINSKFKKNVAKDNGWENGARGGAVWLQDVSGTVTISGDYINNKCVCTGCRGAAFANNRLTGKVTFGGYYSGNKASDGASLWDTHYKAAGDFDDESDVGDDNSTPLFNHNNNVYVGR